MGKKKAGGLKREPQSTPLQKRDGFRGRGQPPEKVNSWPWKQRKGTGKGGHPKEAGKDRRGRKTLNEVARKGGPGAEGKKTRKCP